MGRNGRNPVIAIVDYGVGNLYSIKLAVESVGMQAWVVTSPSEILLADAVILPGVGAFGDAMKSLQESGIADALHKVVESNKPLLGVCLGLQLLMTESCEFGKHRGLGVIPGSVVRFDGPVSSAGPLKVPHVGWNRIWKSTPSKNGIGSIQSDSAWEGTPLESLPEGAYMYFVHSYYVVPEDRDVILSMTRYGNVNFCSSVLYKNIFACQFHPERSGRVGKRVYEAWGVQWFPELFSGKKSIEIDAEDRLEKLPGI